MGWRVELLNDVVRAELAAQALDIRARFPRIVQVIEAVGLPNVHEPYVKHLEGPPWEMRMKGTDGIARPAAKSSLRMRGKGGPMSDSRIPVDDLAREWLQDPEFRAEYDALEGEFALATALIEARARAALTQAQVAARMGTTQAVIARLESGRTKPSTRTLERFARATGMRLRIHFEEPALTRR